MNNKNNKDKLEVFAGLCVLESEDLAMEVASRLTSDLKDFDNEINFTFKGSFDKANRSSVDSFRGPGIESGLKLLEKIKKEFNVPVITDFHYPEQADEVASVVDVIQVPAFLCRQTDMIIAGAKACKKHNSILKIKKGQFLSPEETRNIVEKAGTILDKSHILLTERGSSFGYNNLVVDMASFQIMKSFGVKAIHDATHCVQKPGGLGKSTDGKREQIQVLARAAVAAGADGIFIECHPDPSKALSDPTTAMEISKVKSFISNLLEFYRIS
jgi:2-dehydro-3-deoxyphosphooctonate aldolase (KDO 8-P synthase)